jgi:hypothetical protein
MVGFLENVKLSTKLKFQIAPCKIVKQTLASPDM